MPWLQSNAPRKQLADAAEPGLHGLLGRRAQAEQETGRRARRLQRGCRCSEDRLTRGARPPSMCVEQRTPSFPSFFARDRLVSHPPLLLHLNLLFHLYRATSHRKVTLVRDVSFVGGAARHNFGPSSCQSDHRPARWRVLEPRRKTGPVVFIRSRGQALAAAPPPSACQL
jgi:hypothetical protein